MTTNKYNGWTNRETWLIRLWLDNDESSSNAWASEAQDAYNDASDELSIEERKEGASTVLADKLEGHFTEGLDSILEGVPGGSSSFWADLIGGCLSDVNWGEVADSYMEDVDTEA